MLPSRASDSRVKRAQPETPGTSLFPCMENGDRLAHSYFIRKNTEGAVVKFPRASEEDTSD